MKQYPLHLTNNFNSIKSLKARISMLYTRSSNRSKLFKFLSIIPALFFSLVMLSCNKEILPDPKQDRNILSPPPGAKIVKLDVREDGYAQLFNKKNVTERQIKLPYIFSKSTEYIVKILSDGKPLEFDQNNVQLTINNKDGKEVAYTKNEQDASEIKFTCDKTDVYNVNIQNNNDQSLEVKLLFKTRK